MHAWGIGWYDDDFLIAGLISDTIGVYGSDFTFKGNLDTGFQAVTGLDFDAVGNLVATGRSPGEVRVYRSAGTQVSALNFLNPNLGTSINLKVGPAGNYYVGTQDVLSGGDRLRELSPTGSSLRHFDIDDYDGVAVLPGGQL